MLDSINLEAKDGGLGSWINIDELQLKLMLYSRVVLPDRDPRGRGGVLRRDCRSAESRTSDKRM